MKSMKMSAEERKNGGPETAAVPKEDYPYGLRVRLNSDSIEKVGMTELPKVGTKMVMLARVEVVSTGQYQTDSGKDQNMELQITHLDFGPDDEEGETKSDKLYGAA